MAFLVYLFVLVVAAGSVVFGLDLTQSPLRPPAYATPATQTATITPPVAPATISPDLTTGSATAAKGSAPVRANAVEPVGVAANAQASSEEARSQPDTATAAIGAANHCAIDACTAAYRSFRASDCTYQPFQGERRLCTKTASSNRSRPRVVAERSIAAHHATRDDLHADRTYAERDDERDSYGRPQRSWAFDLFGNGFGR